jgi:hypothetical protein
MVIKHLKQHLPILEEYPTFHDDFVTMLQRVKNVKQLLTTSIIQLILKGLIESLTLETIRTSNGVHGHKGMDKTIFKTPHELIFSHGNHHN